MTLSAVLVTVVVGTILPLLVGLVTKLEASSRLKGALLVVLNVVQGVVIAATAADGSATFTVDTLVLFGVGVLVSLLSYYGVYKPNEVPAKLAPNFGLGSASVNDSVEEIPSDNQ